MFTEGFLYTHTGGRSGISVMQKVHLFVELCDLTLHVCVSTAVIERFLRDVLLTLNGESCFWTFFHKSGGMSDEMMVQNGHFPLLVLCELIKNLLETSF